MSEFYNNSIFWVEVGRINPNPYQPRKEFNDDKIAELADSIRQYGILQPLVVTRKEIEREDGGISVEYELIAGERRLRASKMAGIPQVPVIIRAQEETSKMKLELAIIENLQREDLNAIDRALAFRQLVDEFNLKHIEIAKKVGKSREYVSNTLRLLGLPQHIQNALVAREISEGHARPLLMLGERPQERDTLFTEITTKRLTVRESERIARRIATDKARKQDLSPELIGMEKQLTETLGTRVQIEKRSNKGGKVHIDYFSDEDLKRLLDLLAQERSNAAAEALSTPERSQQQDGESKAPALTPAPAVVVAPIAADAATDAVQRFNDTFKSTEPKPVEQAMPPVEKVDPFKQFEMDTPPAVAPTPTPTIPTDLATTPLVDIPFMNPLTQERVVKESTAEALHTEQARSLPEILAGQVSEPEQASGAMPPMPTVVPTGIPATRVESAPVQESSPTADTTPLNPFAVPSALVQEQAPVVAPSDNLIIEEKAPITNPFAQLPPLPTMPEQAPEAPQTLKSANEYDDADLGTTKDFRI